MRRAVLLCLLSSFTLTASCGGDTCTTDADCFRGEACVREGEQKVCVNRAGDMDLGAADMTGQPDQPGGSDMDEPEIPGGVDMAPTMTIEACRESDCDLRGGICSVVGRGARCMLGAELERCLRGATSALDLGAPLFATSSGAGLLVAGTDNAQRLKVFELGQQASLIASSASTEMEAAGIARFEAQGAETSEPRVVVAAKQRSQDGGARLSLQWLNPSATAQTMRELLTYTSQRATISQDYCRGSTLEVTHSWELCVDSAPQLVAAPALRSGELAQDLVASSCVQTSGGRAHLLSALRPSLDGRDVQLAQPYGLCDDAPAQLTSAEADASSTLDNTFGMSTGQLWSLHRAGRAQRVSRLTWRGSDKPGAPAALLTLPETRSLDSYITSGETGCSAAAPGATWGAEGLALPHPSLRDEGLYLGKLGEVAVIMSLDLFNDTTAQTRCPLALGEATWRHVVATSAQRWVAIAEDTFHGPLLVRGDFALRSVSVERLPLTGLSVRQLVAHADGSAGLLIADDAQRTLSYLPLNIDAAPQCD